MKPYSPSEPLTPAKARNCAILNLCATPGLGSLMAGRYVAGAGQLGLAICGFILCCVWFIDLLRQYYGLMFGEIEPRFHHWLVLSGALVFALAWFWSLVTSVRLWSEASRIERSGPR